jgi:hypothetical protein
MVAHRNQQAQLPLWQSMAWGMLYGGLFSLAATLAAGKPLTFEATVPYVLSLSYLSDPRLGHRIRGLPHAA